jgi:dephospho-CoA kinase
MLRIGLTGGIGSGKTTVAKVFEVLGVPVYYADDAAKRLMNEDGELKKAIISRFGEGAYTNGVINRFYLAAEVFYNSRKLEELNALVHPATLADSEKWMQQQTSPYAIKEAALIFESNSEKYLDYVIGVSAPPALRIQRAMLRDNSTKEDVNARMNKQINEEIKMKRCDFLIINDEEQAVIPQVMILHEKLLELSKQVR